MANKTRVFIAETFNIEDFRPKDFSPLKDQKSKIFPGRIPVCSSATNVVQCPSCDAIMNMDPVGIQCVCRCGNTWTGAGKDLVVVAGTYLEDVGR